MNTTSKAYHKLAMKLAKRSVEQREEVWAEGVDLESWAEISNYLLLHEYLPYTEMEIGYLHCSDKECDLISQRWHHRDVPPNMDIYDRTH